MADEIVDSGGRAEAALVDAINESEVNVFVDSVIRKGGTLDLSFCAVDYQVVQNIPLVRLSVEEFVRPVSIAMRSHFLTATAAGKIMMKQQTPALLRTAEENFGGHILSWQCSNPARFEGFVLGFSLTQIDLFERLGSKGLIRSIRLHLGEERFAFSNH